MERITRGDFLRIFIVGAGVSACMRNTAEIKITPEEITKERLNETLEWMRSHSNREVTEAASKLENLTSSLGSRDSRIVFISDTPTGFSAMATTEPTKNGLKPVVALSVNKFTGENFDVKLTALSLFQAINVYEQAIANPQRFAKDNQFRNYLEKQAQKKAQEASLIPAN